MPTTFEMFLWRSGAIVILVVLAIAGAMLSRAYLAWRRRIGSLDRHAAKTPPLELQGLVSDIAANPTARRTTLAYATAVIASGQQHKFRDAA